MKPIQTLAVAIGIALWLSGTSSAETLSVTVNGWSNLWLIDSSAGFQIENDLVPRNSPPEIFLPASAGGLSISFSATGATYHYDNSPGPMVGAEGRSDVTQFGVHYYYPPSSLSEILAPYMGLIGVFVDSDNVQPIPTSLDYSTASSRSFQTFSPQLQQVFFIGDGLTGNGVGEVQSFVVPVGADSLFLSTHDSHDWANNIGTLRVTVSGLPTGSFVAFQPESNDSGDTNPVPEPSSMLAFVSLALTGAAVAWRRRRNKNGQLECRVRV